MRPPAGHAVARWAALFALLVLGCPAPSPVPDAGVEVPDAGPPPPCDSPSACKKAGFDGVCRGGTCRAGVPCTDDVECGLAESCAAGRCRFTGCAADSECGTGKCREDVYACAECGKSADCPAPARCATRWQGRCLECRTDAECAGGGPAYCDAAQGACVYCRTNDHCPNGLSCGIDGTCHGAQKNSPCPLGVSCDLGLMCVTLNGNPVCLTPCSLYTPVCPASQLCLKLTFSGTNSLVFDKGEPLGICYDPFAGLKYYREVCTRSATAQNCQPNLECVPESAQSNVCRGFCNPNASGTCPSNELCHPFPGDYEDHRYGLCYPDNGWGEACGADSQCRAAAGLHPGRRPFGDRRALELLPLQGGHRPGARPLRGPRRPRRRGAAARRGVRERRVPRRPELLDAELLLLRRLPHRRRLHGGGAQGHLRRGRSPSPATTSSADLTGCRPSCQAKADCAPYGLGLTCRSRVDVTYYVPKLVQTCAPRLGAALLGEPCVVNADCREGLCTASDGRGVLRRGTCSQPCASGADCLGADGGLADGGARVRSAVVPGRDAPGEQRLRRRPEHRRRPARGGEGVPGPGRASPTTTAPEARCARPSVSPVAPLSQLSLRCLAPSLTGVKAGGDPCASDAECRSGACALLQPPSTGSGRVCLMPCGPSTVCPGATSCHTGGAALLFRQRLLRELHRVHPMTKALEERSSRGCCGRRRPPSPPAPTARVGRASSASSPGPQFDRLVQGLARQIGQSFQPEAVVGVAHGGVFVGGAIASALSCEFYPVRISRRSRDKVVRDRPQMFGKMPAELKGRRVLVVDDVAASGETLELARSLAKKAGAKDIATACLVSRPKGYAPTWTALPTDEFFVFPWDYDLLVPSWTAGA